MKKNKKLATVDYTKYLLESLKNPNEALAYLKAALEDEDSRVYLLAQENVKQAMN